jgi:hypothetical protein
VDYSRRVGKKAVKVQTGLFGKRVLSRKFWFLPANTRVKEKKATI